MNTIEKFNNYVIKSDGCWDWKGARFFKNNKPRYAALSINNKCRGAHRVSWEIHFGEIPKGLFVLHKCDNPPCANPEHLFLGNARDNILDMIRKGRTPKNCPIGKKGSEHVASILTFEDAKEIRKSISENSTRGFKSKLAKLYKISPQLISDIISNRRWRDA